MNKGLIALALGTFALGISEFIMMSILINLSKDLSVSISETGHLISAYAAGVCCGAPLLLFSRKFKLKTIMMVLAAVIAIGNLCAALSSSYMSLLVSRFISGLPHGAYFGVGAIVARKLAAPGKEVSAVSLFLAGMTVATLVGVPFGSYITNTFSWHIAFLLVTIAATGALILIRLWVKDVGKLPDMGFKGQFKFLKTLPPWLIFGGVIFGQIGIYCWYSYIDPQLTLGAGFTSDSLSWLMILAGFGMFAGNLIAGRLSDHFKPAAVAASVQAAAMPTLLLFFFFGHYKLAAVVLMMLGTAALFGSGSPLQSSIVGYSKGGEMLGAACIQIAYNAGNAIAAAIGGAAISAGWTYSTTSLIGQPFILTGCILLIILYRRYERTPRKGAVMSNR
ncbi:MAG: MFS transporter [Bacteroidales bacterium]|nr:MFS transporter [Bacteroidales bacterium]MDE6801840.1 MFS transporter [Muribaculaceae bacterium]